MHHIFDVEIATRYGVNAAILLQNMQYWIAHNKANGKCFYEGRFWTYNSAKAFSELFPYMSEYQARTALDKLIEDGVIIKGNFNKTGMDRTLWYAITDKGEAILGHRGEPAAEPEPLNPFGDCGEAEIPDTVEAYAARNLDRLTPGNMQDFEGYKKLLSDELIRHAIDAACGNGVRTWNYVRRILDRYIESGYKSIGQLMAAEDGKSRSRRGNEKPQADNPLLRTKFY